MASPLTLNELSAPHRYQPPAAERRPGIAAALQGERIDPYAWLRDDSRESPEVIAHLEAETAACERWFEPLQPLVADIRSELAARIPPAESGIPYYDQGWWNQTRYRPGEEHPQYVRWREGGAEEPVLDAAEKAKGHAAYTLGAVEVSPDGQWLAYTEDMLGRHEYTLRLVDRRTGESCAAPDPGLDADLAFLNDGTLLYIRQDPVTRLGTTVWAHRPQSDPGTDCCVYTEDDDAFTLSLSRGRSGDLIYLHLHSTTTSEIRVMRAAASVLSFAVTIPRQAGHEYDLEDDGDHYLLRSNESAPDFRVLRVASASVADRCAWQAVLAETPGVVITGILVFPGHWIIAERSEGLGRLRVINRSDGTIRLITATDPAATLWLDVNEDPSIPYVRYATGSLAQPTTRRAFDFVTGEERLLRVDPIAGDYHPERYVAERCWVEARDGVHVPVSLLRRCDTPINGTAPLLLTGYGAYGIAIPAVFDATVLPLVDRGFIYAIAHVRGGDDLGRAWTDGGRLAQKYHTFADFIDVRRALVANHYADEKRCCGTGASAGGLLIGVVANDASSEFLALVAHVPFVDVLSTMLDDDLPLTTLEYEEWGDPSDPDDFAVMAQYSPYDNVRPQDYPAMLVTAGLHDAQVPYWEATKWVASLRFNQTGAAPILFRAQLDAGHAGATGRYGALMEIALEQAFLLECVKASGR
jgi:oligopeptidase B